MILNNTFIETLRKSGIKKGIASDECTGYFPTVTKYYRSIREKHGESVKKEQFVYSFALIDISRRM